MQCNGMRRHVANILYRAIISLSFSLHRCVSDFVPSLAVVQYYVKISSSNLTELSLCKSDYLALGGDVLS